MDNVAGKPEDAALRFLLRELRRQAGLRQQQLAALLGKPQSYVSKYETGERRLDVLELRRVCAACGMSLAGFVERLEHRLAEIAGDTPSTDSRRSGAEG